jgi:plasmid stabilization system protein ParE
MGTRVSWSPEAIDDVDTLAAYISKDSPYYASAVVKKILDTADSLGKFPYIGPIVPEIGEQEFRERFVYSYRLIYRVIDEEVLVVAVIHGRRLLDPILDRFDGSA